MTSIRHESPPEPDSKTSSVGTKRSFNTSTTSESNVINIDFSSEYEMSDKPQKKMRLSNSGGHESPAIPEDFKSDEDAFNDREVFGSKSQLLVESTPVGGRIPNPNPPATELAGRNVISWNKGIQGGLRTSFESRTTVQTHKQFPVSLSNSTEPKNKGEDILRLSAAQILVPQSSVGQSSVEPFLNVTKTSMSPEGTTTDDSASKQGRRVSEVTMKSESRIATTTAFGEGIPVYTEGNVEFGLPVNKDGARKEFENVKFLGVFVPRFMSMNKEKVSKMLPTTPMRAFETYLNTVYRDVSQDRIESKLLVMQQHKKEMWFNTAVKNATGKTRMQLGMIGPNATHNSPKENLSSSSAQHAPLEDLPTRFSDGNKLPDSVASTAPHIIRNGLDVTSTSSVFHMNNSNSLVSLEEQMTSFHSVANLSRPATSSTVSNQQNGSLQENNQVLHDAISAQPQGTSNKTLHSASKQQANDVLMTSTIAEESQVEYDADELALMHRYYPGNTKYPFLPRCLTCSETGHRSSQCPRLNCGFCGFSGLHFKNGCPNYRFCTKCRRRGHLNEDCEEKLKEISGLASCALCNSTEHLEIYCHLQWRSFKLDPATIVLVQDIPMSCYFCGSNGGDGRPAHYGADCGLRRGQIQSGGYTWSKTNWERYVDPQSNLRASSAGKDYIIRSKKGLSIKGTANNPITINNSDEERDGPFAGRQVARQPRPEARRKQHVQFNHQAYSSSFQPSSFNEVFQPSSRTGVRSQETYTSGGQSQPRNNSSYQKRDNSARNGREQSFSPPPQYPHYGDGYQPPLPPGPPPSRLNMSYDNFHAPTNLGPYQALPPPRGQPLTRGGGKKQKKKKKKSASVQGVTGSPKVKKPRGNGRRPARGNSTKVKRGGGAIGA